MHIKALGIPAGVFDGHAPPPADVSRYQNFLAEGVPHPDWFDTLLSQKTMVFCTLEDLYEAPASPLREELFRSVSPIPNSTPEREKAIFIAALQTLGPIPIDRLREILIGFDPRDCLQPGYGALRGIHWSRFLDITAQAKNEGILRLLPHWRLEWNV